MVVRFGWRTSSFLFSDFLSLFAVNNDYIFVVVMVWSSSTIVDRRQQWFGDDHIIVAFSLEFHVSSVVENDQFCYCFRFHSVGRPLYLTHSCIIKNAAVLFARAENCSTGKSARNTSVSSMFSQSAGFRPFRRAIRTPDCHVVRTLSIFQRAAELSQTSKCVCQQLSVRRASSTPQDVARDAAEVNRY